MLGLAEILVNGIGHGLELADLLVLSYKALDHPDAVDIFLNHGVEPVIGLEDPVEDFKHQGHDAQQHQGQNGNGHKIDGGELGADAQGREGGKDQHHGAANGHADAHLEGHLQGGHIGGQPGHNGGGGELVDVGKAVVLDTVVHVVPQILGKACGGLGSIVGRQHPKEQGDQGAQQQQQGLLPHHGHIARGNAPVIQSGHDQRNGHFHGNLPHHGQGAEQGGPLVFPDTPYQSFHHFWNSSVSGSKSGATLRSARSKYCRNRSASSWEKPSRSFLSPCRITAYMVSLQCWPLGRM